MAVVLGAGFEQAVIAAAGLQGLNLDPGSMRIDQVDEPVVTVRFTLVVQVPAEQVRAAIVEAVGGA